MDVAANEVPVEEWEVDESLIDTLLDLTPEQRILRHQQVYELYMTLREAGAKLYGYDPRTDLEAQCGEG